MRSPVAIGIVVWRAISISASLFSGSTGSSIEHRLERLQLLRQHLGHRLMHAPVEVDPNRRSHSRPRRAPSPSAIGRSLDFAPRVDPFQLSGRVHLQRGVAGCDALTRRCRASSSGRSPPIQAIHTHAVAHRAAQQIVHRHAQPLALDIPQRLVDADDRAGQDRPAAIEAAAIQRLPDILDLRRHPCRSE